jgi:hypothetical protein
MFLKQMLNMFSGDPLDRSLRKVEIDILIPKKMRDKARDEKCREVVSGRSHEYTRWFKYDRDYLCVNKSQFVPVIFEPPCTNCSHQKLYFVMCATLFYCVHMHACVQNQG